MIANLMNAGVAIILSIVFGKMPAFKKFDPDYIPTEEEAKKIEEKKQQKLKTKEAKSSKKISQTA